MVDLTNIELVIFDFDDTLCIHPRHGYTEEDVFELEMKAYDISEDPWEEHSKNRHMQEFINECVERKLPMGMMSLVSSFNIGARKIDWVKDNYGIAMENFSVGNRQDKLRLLKVLECTMNISRNHIMIIDDRSDTLNEAAENGFIAVSPMQIVNYIENK